MKMAVSLDNQNNTRQGAVDALDSGLRSSGLQDSHTQMSAML